jgi:serine/threonine-protein kinase
MFRDEARLAAKLSHPHIIQIHELGFTDGCYYICMEYLAGEDFSTTVRLAGRRRQYVPLPVVARVLIDAARGLHYAHEFTNEQGQPLHVVHRDVSPSNLYLTYQGQVKVLDFGIAKAESRLVHTRTGVVKGKYMYMAPEQAQGKEVDRRADVFALGVSLYEAITHVRPFARENDLAVLNALMNGDFQPPRALRPDLPEELEAIILKAMAFKPEDRYATAADFADALEAFLAANLSASGTSVLAAFLRGHFGDERFTEKTRIPTLATLSAAHPTEGVPLTGPGAAATGPGTAAYGGAPRGSGAVDSPTKQGRAWVPPVSEASAPAPGTPTSSGPLPRPAPASRGVRTLAIGLVSGLLIAGGGLFVSRQFLAKGSGAQAHPAGDGPGTPHAQGSGSGDAAQGSGNGPGTEQAQGPGTDVAAQAPPGNGSGAQQGAGGVGTGLPTQGSGATATAPGAGAENGGAQAPGGEVKDPSGATPAVGSGSSGRLAFASASGTTPEGDEPSARKSGSQSGKRVTLGITDIQRVVSGGRSRITSCFERYKMDLPASQGEVQVQLTIVSSGKVKADTKGPLASTGVGRCLEAQAQRLRFPAHRDQEVTVMMPFSWRVTQ